MSHNRIKSFLDSKVLRWIIDGSLLIFSFTLLIIIFVVIIKRDVYLLIGSSSIGASLAGVPFILEDNTHVDIISGISNLYIECFFAFLSFIILQIVGLKKRGFILFKIIFLSILFFHLAFRLFNREQKAPLIVMMSLSLLIYCPYYLFIFIKHLNNLNPLDKYNFFKIRLFLSSLFLFYTIAFVSFRISLEIESIQIIFEFIKTGFIDAPTAVHLLFFRIPSLLRIAMFFNFGFFVYSLIKFNDIKAQYKIKSNKNAIKTIRAIFTILTLISLFPYVIFEMRTFETMPHLFDNEYRGNALMIVLSSFNYLLFGYGISNYSFGINVIGESLYILSLVSSIFVFLNHFKNGKYSMTCIILLSLSLPIHLFLIKIGATNIKVFAYIAFILICHSIAFYVFTIAKNKKPKELLTQTVTSLIVVLTIITNVLISSMLVYNSIKGFNEANDLYYSFIENYNIPLNKKDSISAMPFIIIPITAIITIAIIKNRIKNSEHS